MTQPATPADIHHLHEAALEGAIRLSIRCGKSRNPRDTWAHAQGASMSWAFHQALTRLTELDPEGTTAFAADLIEELEDGNYGDAMCDTALDLGIDPEPWIDLEHKPDPAV